jgi:hypothetical protein
VTMREALTPGLSAARRREFRGHEAQEAIADHKKTQNAAGTKAIGEVTGRRLMHCGELKTFFCYLKPRLLIERTNRSIRMFLGFFGRFRNSSMSSDMAKSQGGAHNFSSMATLWATSTSQSPQ